MPMFNSIGRCSGGKRHPAIEGTVHAVDTNKRVVGNAVRTLTVIMEKEVINIHKKLAFTLLCCANQQFSNIDRRQHGIDCFN